jgi:small subunit ribosomal protein S13e
MGRMYGRGKGISKSSIPYKKKPPRWLNVDSTEVVKQIEALAKKGYKPSQIGVILRDNYAIPQSRLITGAKILRILKKKGLAPQIPEDLYHLMKRAVTIRKHIEKNKRDKDSKYRLILVESKIHRLVRYYKLTKQIPANWRYDYQTALALVS